MRYRINFDKTINQLVPYYLGGRKLILYLQALMSPLRLVNDKFVEYAKETRIEAAMTSQTFKFQWYLNRKFSRYFAGDGQIAIANAVHLGVPVYHETANIPDSDNILMFAEHEQGVDHHLVLYRSAENTINSGVSFCVTTPRIDTRLISESKYIAMLRSAIERYRLANKTYIIQYSSI